jgi:hypothetical protein
MAGPLVHVHVSGPRGELRGSLRAALYHPEPADKWQRFSELLRYRTSLQPALNELAIRVTARHCHAQLEWFIHAQSEPDGRRGRTIALCSSAGTKSAWSSSPR